MTKFVKIVLLEDSCDDYYSQCIIRDSISDWEEISDEDYEFLRGNLYRFVDVPYNMRPSIVMKDYEPVVSRIANIRAEVEKQRAKDEAEKQRKEQIKQDKIKARLLKKAESELALLEQLKSKYGDKV